MGTLLTCTEIGGNAKWYFTDAYYDSDGRGRYIYKWPSNNFPYMCSISQYILDDTGNNANKVAIRKWINSNISDVVIYDILDNTYRRYYGNKSDNYSTVRNEWYRFFFEDAHSHLAFSLAFSDIIQPITEWHPKYPDDEEYLRKKKEEGLRI